jgi:hypothetical protein
LSDGSGLGTQIVRAIQVLAQFGQIDIGSVAANDPSNRDGAGNPVDAIADFVQEIRADNMATAPCAMGLQVADRSPPGDGIPDTFLGVTPGERVCFDVVPKMNTVVSGIDRPLLFRATITVVGGGVTNLSTRQVFFLVPPVIRQPPINLYAPRGLLDPQTPSE